MNRLTVTRYHDISCGHRVYGHEGKCKNLHGHNYRIHFTLSAVELDTLNRVLDFGVIKTILCAWLEDTIDHKFLVWKEDPAMDDLCAINPDGVIVVDFNPTAEAIAEWLLGVGQLLLDADPFGAECTLTSVRVEETRKCSAEVHRG